LSRTHGGAHLDERAAAFAEALGQVLRHPVRAVLARGHDHLREGIRIGGIDFAWMAPLVHLRACEEGAILAAVCERSGALTYRSALLMREDTNAQIDRLRMIRVAWVDAGSASGYVFPKRYLLKANPALGRTLSSESFVGSFAGAASAVARGDADLAACYVHDRVGSDLALALKEVRHNLGLPLSNLRVAALTEAIPPDGIVLADALEPLAQVRVRDALLALHLTDAGRSALALFSADRLRGVTLEVARLINGLRLDS
jgi:ABC-type phosphate/phosphonate transport system substrate-binding protein